MRITTKVAVLSLPLALAGQALAGDYHKGTQLICSDCHIMHFSQTHGYDPPGTQSFLGSGPNAYLLRAPINDLCLSCHNNSVNGPDVLDVDTGMYSATVDSRSAGYLNSLTVGDQETGHTLDSTDNAPGSSPTWNSPDGLHCTDCHAQHGYGGPSGYNQYRNLVYNPGNVGDAPVLYASGTNNLTLDVFARKVAGDGAGAGDGYDESQVDWNEPDITASAIADWCKGCHTNFHGAVGGAEIGGALATGEFLRHPAAEVNIGGIGGGHSSLAIYQGSAGARVKVMDPNGLWGATSTDITPTCISCHKAHGNGNKFGLIYRDPADTVTDITEDGSTNGTQYEHLCKQCHNQASAF